MPVDVRILIRLDRRPTENELGEWNKQLLERFEDEFFIFDSPLGILEGWEFNIIEEYPQHTWLQSHWAQNYYDEEYERGDFQLIVEYIDTIQEMMPGSEIYYGPDSVDDIQPFSDQRQELNDHWNRVRNEPYNSRMIAFRMPAFLPTPPVEYSEYLITLTSEASKIEIDLSIAADSSIETDLFSGSHPADEASSSLEAGFGEIDPSTYIRCETTFEAIYEDVCD